MSPGSTCPNCGALLPATVPPGIYPARLMKLGLELSSSRGLPRGTDAATGPFDPRVVATIDHVASSTQSTPRPVQRMPEAGERVGTDQVVRMLDNGEMGAVNEAAMPSDVVQARPPVRIEGFDVARAVAIVGMVVIHFTEALSYETMPARLQELVGLLDGRAAALFVILAGIGVTLMTRSAVSSGDAQAIRQARWLCARAWSFSVCFGVPQQRNLAGRHPVAFMVFRSSSPQRC